MTICRIHDCDRPLRSKKDDICATHYDRRRRGWTDWDTRPVRNYRKYLPFERRGYLLIYKPDHPTANRAGCIFQHTFVMSEALGRPLMPHENVHHKNGDRKDNRLSNLELWSTSQPPGQRMEDKVAWAKEILALYGNQGEPCL